MKFPRWYLAIGFSLVFTGCVTHGGVARSSVQFNKAVEEGQNQMLLLNILRASRKRPLYLTSFSKVTGSNSASVEVNVPNGPGKTVKGAFGANPTFDVPVLDSQEFTNGFMAPVKSSLVGFYWNQDWPEELLFHLLVQKVLVRVVEEDRNGGKVVTRVNDYYFWNHPDLAELENGKGLCKLEKFSRWVNYFVAIGNPGFRPADSTPIGPTYTEQEVKLKNLTTLLKDGFELTEDGGKYVLNIPSKDYELEIAGALSGGDFEQSRRQATQDIREWTEKSTAWQCDPEEHESFEVEERDEQRPSSRDAMTTGQALDAKGDKKLYVSLFLRSPEAVVYYLGQLLRVEERYGIIPRICIDRRLQALFVAQRSTQDCAPGVVDVQYDSVWYTIPRTKSELLIGQPVPEVKSKPSGPDPGCEVKPFELPKGTDKLWIEARELGCESGRSMQALTLLNQLINLQKSGKDLPTTGTVRVIGQL